MYILVRDDRYVPGAKWEVEEVKDRGVTIYGAKYFESFEEADMLAEEFNDAELKEAGMVREWGMLDLKNNNWCITYCNEKEFIEKANRMGIRGDTVKKVIKYIEDNNLQYSVRDSICKKDNK